VRIKMIALALWVIAFATCYIAYKMFNDD